MAKKLYFKIGEACKELDIQPYVLRYWETEFSALSPSKSKSGQRVYSVDDLDLIRQIKKLLYDEGYTIAGAKKRLEKEAAGRSSEAKEAVEAAEAPAAGEKKVVSKPAKKPSPAKAKTAAARSAELEKLRKGIREALHEARQVLEILDSADRSE